MANTFVVLKFLIHYEDTTHYVFEPVLIADHVLTDVIVGGRLLAALAQEQWRQRFPSQRYRSTLPHKAQT